jgi:DNA replication protein DnaC
MTTIPSPTSTDCIHCKTRERVDGKAYCAECTAKFAEREERLIRENLEQLAADYPRERHTTFDTLEVDDHNRRAIERAREQWPYPDDPDDPYCDGEYRTLFLAGSIGSGKTVIAYCAVRHMLIQDEGESTGRLIVVRDLIAKARAAMTRGDRTDPIQDLIDSKPDYLILDDLGAERGTDWSREVIARIVDARYRDPYAKTIVTTNYTPSQLATRLGNGDPVEGQRIVSRLREDALVIKLTGPDRRVVEQTQLRIAS